MTESPSEELPLFFRNAGFTETESRRIASFFVARTYRKGDMVLQEGMPCQRLGLVQNGLFVHFLLSRGEERITYVAGQQAFLASLWSFLKDVPSHENIRCVADGRVWFIQKPDLRRLQAELPGFDAFYTRALENEVCCIEESRYDLIALTAEERYEKLLKTSPHLLQQIPLQYLAALLGITPRHLSRIRARIA